MRLGRFLLWISAAEFPPDPKFLRLSFCGYIRCFILPAFVSASDTLARGPGDGHVPRGRGPHSRPLGRVFTAGPARVTCFRQGRGFMALWTHGPTPCPCPPCLPYPLPCPPCPPCISSCVSGQVPRARHCLPRPRPLSRRDPQQRRDGHKRPHRPPPF